MRASRRAPRVAIAALALAVLGGGCSEPNALLITITAERPVQTLDFLVRDQAAGVTIDEHLDVPLGGQDISKQGLKIAERFSKPGTYLIHVVGKGGAGLQVATRAYAVEGAVEVTLKLVALDATNDADGDGFPSPAGCAALASPSLDCAFADCDDHDSGTNPFARERCNGKDDDCDGVLPAEEADADGDGFLACAECDPNSADWNPAYWDCRDCDDTRADVHPASRRDKQGHPAAAEDCTSCGDHVDHNCNGVADEGCNDHDCDGFPACGAPGAPPPPLCDCNDNDPAINPGKSEACGDGIDNNCDGQTDEGCLPCDLDGDGFLRDDPANNCLPAPGEVDCDDYDSGIQPGAADGCGGKEGGCREMALRGYCRYTNAADPPIIHDCKNRPPSGTGVAGCPPRECDHDGDGFMRYDPANGCNPPAALADCNDEDPHIFPGAPDYCGNGIAENCNSDLPCDHDADGDHYNEGDDCDDTDPLRHPWALELCDGIDNDCDGLTDEGNPNATSGASVTGVVCTDSNVGECGKRPGICVCSKTTPNGTRDPADRVACPDENLAAAASPRCFGAAQPRPETFATCNGLDDDCNGRPDDAPGEVPCAVGDLCRGAGTSWKCTCSTDTGCDGCCLAGAADAPDQCVPVGELSVAQCGIAGAACASCEDGNPCTTDSCDGACHHVNVADHTSCPGGQCRIPAAAAGICCAGCWTGTACVSAPAAGCGTAGGDCAPANTGCGNCKVCDGAGQCGNVPVGQDPNGQCPDEGVAGCGRNGACDGAGACQLYATGTACATCKTCDGAGHCGNVAAGDDPNSQCTDEGGCGHDGACDGSGACRYYGASVRCGTCRTCNGAGACSGAPADDPACGTIACGGLTTTCRSYADVTSNRCVAGGGSCKPPNTAATCTGFANTGANTRCGNCKVCDGNGACGNVNGGQDPNNDCAAAAASTCGQNGSCDGSGNCALFATGTGCATCAQCDGGGHCNQTPGDDAACGTIGCSTLSTTCRTYSNLTASRCKALGTCKGVNATDCTTFSDAPGTTSCGLCSHCSGGGACSSMPADDGNCGTITCSSLSTTCRTYSDLTTNRCKTLGACKQAPTDCSAYTNHPGAACATCKTCDASGGCTGLIGTGQSSGGACATQAASTCGTDGNCDGAGACEVYPSGTVCGTCKRCGGTGAGSCAAIPDGAAPSDCTAQASTTCGNTGNCKGGACEKWAAGTACGTECHQCDGAGTCVPVANNTACGSKVCCGGVCCPGATTVCTVSGGC
ncbi:MAG TPA: putative metal-binding motif-containing protein [Polyangia bacterium]